MKIWYWLKEGFQITFTVFVASLVYGMLMATSLGNDVGDYLLTGCLYLVMMGVIMAPLSNLALYRLHIPLTLGFGARRKSVALGLHIYRLVLMVPVLIALWAVLTVTGDRVGNTPWFLTALAAAAFFLFNALGSLMGILTPKLSKGAITALSVILMLTALFVIGVVTVLLLVFADINTWLVWIILGVSALAYGVCSLVEYRAIRRFCVK